jgi:hypothetical protein
MCLLRAPEKYIAGAALDRAGLDSVGSSTSHDPVGLHGLFYSSLHKSDYGLKFVRIGGGGVSLLSFISLHVFA